MSCNHKFKSYLNLERIDFEPTTLMVGTFNPEWPAGNTSEWFYGRTLNEDGELLNNFWDVLPRLYNEPSLINAGPAEWKQFCHDKKIALTDLISNIDDANPANKDHNKLLVNFADKGLVWNFEDFEFVNIIQLLKKHPTIENVYLTRGIIESFWKHLWNPVMRYCTANNIRERRLISPSGYVFFQDAATHNESGEVIPLQEDYTLMKWKAEWHV
jgi:hypothetical protein